jgi:hypothetical protein
MRRPVSLRVKIAVAGLAGVGVAWLLPKGGTGPATPGSSVTPTDRPGVTAVAVPLVQIPEGVSFRLADGVRVFLVRSGSSIVAFHGRATIAGGGDVWWCARNGWFESEGQAAFYGRDGTVGRYSAPRNLERIRVLVAGTTATIFPHDVTPGPAAPPTPSGIRLAAPPPPCSASERLG